MTRLEKQAKCQHEHATVTARSFETFGEIEVAVTHLHCPKCGLSFGRYVERGAA